MENNVQEGPRTQKSPSWFGPAHSPWLESVTVLDVHQLRAARRPAEALSQLLQSDAGLPDTSWFHKAPCLSLWSHWVTVLHSWHVSVPTNLSAACSKPARPGPTSRTSIPRFSWPWDPNAYPDFLQGNLKPQSSGLSWTLLGTRPTKWPSQSFYLGFTREPHSAWWATYWWWFHIKKKKRRRS